MKITRSISVGRFFRNETMRNDIEMGRKINYTLGRKGFPGIYYIDERRWR